jgi:hypothetical protein
MWSPDEMAARAHYDDYVSREMYERRKEIVKQVSTLIGQDYAEQFLTLVSAARSEDMPESDFFINLLRLDDKDWCCVKDDRIAYKDILLEERMDSYGWHYVEA